MSFKLRNEQVKKAQRVLSLNPHIDQDAGVYLAVYQKYCKDPNEARLFYKALAKCSRHTNGNFESYFVNLLDYHRAFKPKNTDGLYNKEYISKLYNITLEAAGEQIAKTKANKSTSLEKFIARHGQEEGSRLFHKFVGTSNWRPGFLQAYGKDQLDYKNKTCTKRSTAYWLTRGYNEDAAKKAVSKHQRENSGVHPDFYRKQGFLEDQINAVLTSINARKDSRTSIKITFIETYGYPTWEEVYQNFCKLNNDCRSPYFFKRKYGDLWEIKYLEARAKWKTFDPALVPAWLDYKERCWFETRIQLAINPDKIEDISKRGIDFHLDHIYSVFDGFKNDVDPKVIGHYTNLRIITARENLSKNTRSDKSKEDLLSDYSKSLKD